MDFVGFHGERGDPNVKPRPDEERVGARPRLDEGRDYPVTVLGTSRHQIALREIADLLPDRGTLERSAICPITARLLPHRGGEFLVVEIQGTRVGEVDARDVVYGPLIAELRDRAPLPWPALIVGGRELRKGYRATYWVRLAATDPPGGADSFAERWWKGQTDGRPDPAGERRSE